MTTVTRITGQAETGDELTVDDYQDIYAEISNGRSTRQVAEMLGGVYSNGWWSEFGKSRKPVTREAASALRRAVGMAPLPATVVEAVGELADPDAEVIRVRANGRVNPLDLVIVTERVSGLVLRIEGMEVSASVENAENGGVRAITPHCGAQRRRRIGRVSVTPATVGQNGRRQAMGATWAAVIEAGLQTLEAQGD